MLNLHIRLNDMRFCAFIQISSLPVAWIVVGAGVLAVLLVMAILFLLKLREVAALKKEVFELRDTIRMMRYEELSLSRMVHKASEPMTPLEGDLLLAMAEDPAKETEEAEPSGQVGQAQSLQEALVGELEEVSAEDSAEVSEVESTENVIENPTEILENPTESIENPTESPARELPVAPTHKQPITGRRPAIPTDLFAAWFAENEDAPAAEAADEVLQQVPSEPQPEEVELAAVEVPVAEVSATDVAAEEADAMERAVQEHVEDLPVEPAAEVELSKEDERFCRKLERFVGARLRNPNLNIDVIAAQFGVGRTNFYRKVRELTGMSPNDYLRKCRMERAAELLQHSDVAISDVCAQVGIPDAQYFSRVFKTYFGVTPSVYREKHNQ